MAKDIDDKIKLALQECGGIWCYDMDNKFRYIYPFTTENIAGYINEFDLNNKSLLTVGSSGDQVLNAILYDCKDISVIDLCPFAKEFFYLKKAAIEVFSREEYLKFLCYYKYNRRNNNNAFCKNEYNKLKEVLVNDNEEVAYFWNTLYNCYRGLRIRKRLFSFDETEFKYLANFNNYLSSDIAYQSLRGKINKANVVFSVGNLFNIDINNTFDFINLSNIIDTCSLDQFNVLLNKMISCLSNEGILLMAYLYLINDGSINIKLRIEKIKKFLPKDTSFLDFTGVSGIRLDRPDSHDGVVTYKKIKK